MTGDARTNEVRHAVATIWRAESARLIAALVRRTGDVSTAEDLAQDALMAALAQWPQSGIPENPGAWLMQSARHRAIDGLRRGQRLERKHAELAEQLDAQQRVHPEDQWAQALDDHVGDDVLRLLFMTCHPVLAVDAQVALTLRLLGGLTTAEIGRAYLAPESTIAQRIVRAKRTLNESRVPFEMPRGAALGERVGSVLRVLYLVFNEGYAASAGDDWMRPALADEALRLARLLTALMPEVSEAHGLLALMELQWSRADARIGPNGTAVLLLDQDRSRWDLLAIRRGLAAQSQAESLTGTLGPYALQAAIAACHARATTASETDWVRIVALYDGLVELTGSPVVELNRAVAVSMAFGPAEGLMLLAELSEDPALRRYHLLPAARGDMLDRAGRVEEAIVALREAVNLAENTQDRAVLEQRITSLTQKSGISITPVS
ncbi:MAG TPA: RNA polymerase subunit sigma-24 [Gemmatimonas aurantiaca]|uniref:RNA polymerase ECF-type sigma factor n=2 Tax=Gemmatimonas aurantiaca TaxID=173480 RepID=C1ACR8_GEMAT|nr:sigma-70 family RNA polymerase sigma factor [Gemmatimonas aurantiaca]BAH40295.1 RNA polymerase ECF-type sigma factor [Gemmatimonas aurantiaca T-27]HCT57695.1 RNA polymerase subunit sigma-24 [Gemmatimonas aurantiaca]